MRTENLADGRVRQKLETWGEIATYLGVEVRTAQRWEKRLGLPIVRLEGSQAVYCYSDHLDAWRQSREQAPRPPEPMVPAAPFTRFSTAQFAFIAVIVVGVAAVAWSSVHPKRGPHPVNLVLEGNRLIATDRSGSPVWDYDFDSPTGAADIRYRFNLPKWWERVDIDADGVDELLVLVRHPTREIDQREALYCFTLDGRLRYRVIPEINMMFESRSFSGPWRFWDFEVVPEDRSLWVVVESAPWWPSAALRIDEHGGVSVRYVQPGLMQALKSIRRGDKAYVLAGGINNEFHSASLAMLDPQAGPASAPEKGSGEFTCRNCPSGKPLSYLLFEQSPLNVAEGHPYNQTISISSEPDGLSVGVLEALTDNMTAVLVYRLAADLVPQSVIPSDAYWTWRLQGAPWSGRDGHPRTLSTRSWSQGRWITREVPVDGLKSGRK